MNSLQSMPVYLTI